MHSAFFATLRALALLLLAAAPLAAHEGHNHEAPPPSSGLRVAPRAEASSELFELVAVAEGQELAIYVDRFATNAPVEGAIVEVETPTGPMTATPNPGGAYRLAAPWFGAAGSYDLIITLMKDGAADVFPVTLAIADPVSSPLSPSPISEWLPGRSGLQLAFAALVGFFLGMLSTLALRRSAVRASLAVIAVSAVLLGDGLAHEGEEHGPAVVAPAQVGGRDLAQRLPDGGVFMPKPTQRLLAIRTAMTEIGGYRRATELPGRIIPDPDASGYAQASVGGRLAPPPGGFPKLGTPVRKGDVLAYVTPPLQAIDVSDMRQRQGEIEQQISIVERRVARFASLVPSGAVPRAQLEDAQLELEGLKQRRAALESARREPEALVAPVDGVVAEGSAVAGQMAQPNAVVFHILDPTRLWVEALSFEAMVGVPTASARTGNDRVRALAFRGSGFSDRNQSIPMHFAIEGDLTGLRVGQLVTVFVSADEEKQGIALPRASVVRGANGQDLVYLHTAAERFEARQVRIEPLDGDRVLVAAGIVSGMRVVIQGAELLDQVR